MKTILATAYAINPYKGSEDGMGWNFALQIARFNHLIIYTRENNQPAIEKYMAENPDPLYRNIIFRYYDLPEKARFWKKGSRGAMLYYLLWQYGVYRHIRKNKIQCDIVHNLNFHNDWTPSFLWKLNVPFVWGPVGHHPAIPPSFLKKADFKTRMLEWSKWKIKKAFWNLSPALRATVKNADHIFCMNSEAPKVLGLKSGYSIVPSVATQDFGKGQRENHPSFTIISAGRLVPLKGFDLTIQSFSLFCEKLNVEERSGVKLLIIGSGPDQRELEQLAQRGGHADKITFIPWIDRSDLMKLFRESSAFLFPSHEGAGMVVAEALSFGLPVICLDNSGPGEFIDHNCGFAVKGKTSADAIVQMTDALQTLYSDSTLHEKMSHEARKKFETAFDWNVRGHQLQEIYATL